MPGCLLPSLTHGSGCHECAQWVLLLSKNEYDEKLLFLGFMSYFPITQPFGGISLYPPIYKFIN